MKQQPKTTASLPVLKPHAAGIDIGATEVFVAVPEDADAQPIRRFPTFTQDLQTLAAWLGQCGVRTVAMESTGVYWIPLFELLEARGFHVCLVNAHHLHSVPGRKTDVCDCQWLQYLHACGLLHASFRPEEHVCAVRALMRHRTNLIAYAASHVQHMQKSLVQMNLQLHHVISDLSGKTGLAMIDAILAGERDPERLANLRDARLRASKETIVKSLVGNYRPEHLFTLKQALDAYRHYQQLLAECDQEIERLLSEFDSRIDPEQAASSAPAPKKRPSGNDIRLSHTDMATELHRILGVDLLEVPSLGMLTIHTLLTEIGRDLSAFPSDKHFASWLGLCPGNKISGGKVLSSRTRQVRNRAAQALRMAVPGLRTSRCGLGDYFRRMCARMDKAAAITATAHKLARIIYHLLTTGERYDESVFEHDQERARQRRERRLRRDAIALGYQLVPQSPVT
jgi:transposase